MQLPALGKDNDSGRNMFVMALPAEGKPVSNALTHNPVVEAGTPAQGGETDGAYQFYINDVFNMEAELPEGYESFGGAQGDGAALSEKTAAPAPSSENYALNRPYETSDAQEGRGGNPVDGNVDTYWESSGLPAVLNIDLEQTRLVDTVGLKPRDYWGSRSQKVAMEYSLDGRTYSQLVPAKDYNFEKPRQNALEAAVPETEMRYLRLHISWASDARGHALLSEVEVYGPLPAAENWFDRHVETQKTERKSGAAGLLKKLDEPVTGRVILEARVRSDQNNQDMLIPAPLDEAGKTAAALRLSADGYIQAASEDGWRNIVPYTKGEWYTLKLPASTAYM
ncbi:MAG: discoidin domain-containing protein [Clostridiales bacterium]|nr:discoidin domain-containing protein [Clostridiales bacterium]